MPDITRLQLLQFFILVMALPAQYYLVKWSGTQSEATRSKSLQSILQSYYDVKETVLNQDFSKIKQWTDSKYKKIIQTVNNLLRLKTKSKDLSKNPPSSKDMINGESIAAEIFKFRNPEGYFGSSITPRTPRPLNVKYRVGQVFKHKIHGYRGVIVGWDEKCKAPEHWIKAMHGNNNHWRTQPNYSVLVDSRDRPDQYTYVVEENIEVVTNTPIKHKELYDYFNFYDGAQYHMRPALQAVYPHD